MWRWPAICSLAVLVSGVPAHAESTVRVMDLATNDLVFNRTDGRFYASTLGNSPLGNSIAVIDPASATVTLTIPVAGEPGSLSLSDNGRYLYVLLKQQSAIQRVDLWSSQVDETLAFGQDRNGAPITLDAIGAVPGSPQSVAVVLHNLLPRLAIYDGLTSRPNAEIVPYGPVQSIQFGDTLGWVFAQSRGGAAHYAADVNGSYVGDSLGLHSNSDDPEMYYRNGVVYFAAGGAVPLATFPRDYWSYNLDFRATSVFPEPEANRVYYVHRRAFSTDPLEIVAFFHQARVPAARLDLPITLLGDSEARRLQRWGSDGLAFRTTDNRVVFIRSTDLIPPPLPPVDLAVTLRANAGPPRLGEGGLFTITVTNRGTQPASDVSVHGATSPLALGQPWVEYYAGGLAPGASKTFAWSITANYLPSVTATVRVTSNETEINPTDNTATYASPVAPSRKWNLITSWETLRRVHTASGDRLQGILVVQNLGLAKSQPSKVELEQVQDDEHNAAWVSLGKVKTPAIAGLRSVRIAIDRPLPRSDYSWVRARTKSTVIFRVDWIERYAQIPTP